jgi:hypothetical protein
MPDGRCGRAVGGPWCAKTDRAAISDARGRENAPSPCPGACVTVNSGYRHQEPDPVELRRMPPLAIVSESEWRVITVATRMAELQNALSRYGEVSVRNIEIVAALGEKLLERFEDYIGEPDCV